MTLGATRWAVGSWAMRPSTIRGAWGLFFPSLWLSYLLQGGLLATAALDWERSAYQHLIRLFVSCALGVMVAWLSTNTTRLSRALPRVVVALSVAVVCVAATHPTYPPLDHFRVGLRNAARLGDVPEDVREVPAPFGVDRTFLVRVPTDGTPVRGTFDDHVLVLSHTGVEVDGRAIHVPQGHHEAFAMHRLGPHWLMSSDVGWTRVVAGPRSGRALGVAHAFPGRVGTAPFTQWSLVLSAPLGLVLLVMAERARRRSQRIANASHGTPSLDDQTIHGPDGVLLKLATTVPASTQTVFVHAADATHAYREEPRPEAMVIEASPFDRDETLARARTRIARLDALCVLVVLLLTAPALGAHLRGLTVSLPFGYNAAR